MDQNNINEKDRKILDKMRPEEKKKFQFFPSPSDEDERPWIIKNIWWILIIAGALLISILR